MLNLCCFRMRQAWNSSLTEQQTKAAVTLYGETRVQESALATMKKLILTSKSPGTIGIYTGSIRRWQTYANRNGFQVRKFRFVGLYNKSDCFRFSHLRQSALVCTYLSKWKEERQSRFLKP